MTRQDRSRARKLFRKLLTIQSKADRQGAPLQVELDEILAKYGIDDNSHVFDALSSGDYEFDAALDKDLANPKGEDMEMPEVRVGRIQ